VGFVMKDGDVIEVNLEGIGAIRNKMGYDA
jgi:2-keto-4-pentenoate hydratase/2-oxohepta-3-ene-1,7-dioic acid hydratase in catechol pathway